MIDTILFYEEVRVASKKVLNMRSAKGRKKKMMFLETQKANDIYVKDTYYLSDEELKQRIAGIDSMIEEFFTEVDINQIL